MIFDNNETLFELNEKIPGIVDVMRNAYKTAVFALVSVFSWVIGVISPKTMLKVYLYFGLVTLPKHPASKKEETETLFIRA